METLRKQCYLITLEKTQTKKCLIPSFDGVVFSAEWQEAYGLYTSRHRHDHARSTSGNTAIASFGPGVEPELRDHPKTVLKWRKRTAVEDFKTGSREPHSTVLS